MTNSEIRYQFVTIVIEWFYLTTIDLLDGGFNVRDGLPTGDEIEKDLGETQ